ncbi:MAG: hypothetical protein JRF02_10055 [Deltaproteobacteria bacterium]|nr:hypothetical protein [Deltaproteobacteria bacterium]
MTGYLVFHPLIMLLSYLMTTSDSALGTPITVGAFDVVLLSFSINMLPWSLSFAFFNGIIGFYYGTLKAEKIAREELIDNLQKVLADVKTLSGMLPICAWCKKIRNDEGYWQKIEAYFKTRTDLDFTHSICHDCAQKEYPDLYSESEQSSNSKTTLPNDS